MLKYLLIFLTVSSICFSQSEIIIILQDIETKEPISNATVTILRTNKGLVSNDEGIIKFDNSKVSSIEVIHTSYKKKTFKSSTLTESINIVYLENNVRDLEEIILTDENPQNILKSLIKNSIKKLTIPANLKVYTREFFKKNDAYLMYHDGLLNFQLFEENKKIKVDILVEQNRLIGFLDNESHEILGYNLNNIIENYYQFKYLELLFDQKAKKRYDFQLKSYPNNSNYYVINVKPYFDQEGLYSHYRIVYDSKNKLIIEVSSFLAKDRVDTKKKKLDFKNRNIFKTEFINTYRLEGNEYYLANSKEEIGFTIDIKGKEEKIEVKNYLNITEFRTKIFNYNQAEVFKDKSLIFKKNSIITDFWNLESGITLTKEEKDIINNITK